MVIDNGPLRSAVPAGRVPTSAKVQINIIRTKSGLGRELVGGRPYDENGKVTTKNPANRAGGRG